VVSVADGHYGGLASAKNKDDQPLAAAAAADFADWLLRRGGFCGLAPVAEGQDE